MRLHRRALLPVDCLLDHWAPGCWPPPVPSTYDPGLAPSPSPSGSPPIALPPCPQVSIAPAPAPAPANRGRRDQGGGMPGYGTTPGGGGGGDDHHRQVVTYALIAAGVIAFVSLILLGVSVAVRRRQVRRRRQALLAPAAPAGDANGGGGGDGPDGGGWGGGGVVHHVWYIRTVGLDEAAINSIAVARYRAGAGLLGAADCSVCLGEFQDGELVRLLPKCGHAFHVPCIDTWLRAHVNCPLCRSDVLDPAGAGAESSGGPSSSMVTADPDANANDAAGQTAAASDTAPDQEGDEESDGRGASSPEEDGRQDQSSSASPEPLPPPQLFCALPRNVRRAASMDAAIVSSAADVAALDRLPEAAPEEEEQQIGGRRKRGTGQRGGLSTDRPASVGVPRSFFARHCRARSSVLPLGLD
ncbi:hypothetical protein BS78_06G115200 [Paspalum vaginatum]|nr:hypothetical protein BS78_06G115200 [Paspalum vaginatum]